MGAQDNLDFAYEFVETTGVESAIMVWDEGFLSWQYYGIRGQPTAVLLDPTGQPITGWSGRFPEDEVLELAADFL